MNTVHAAALAACALGISFCISAQAAADTDGNLLTSVATPETGRNHPGPNFACPPGDRRCAGTPSKRRTSHEPEENRHAVEAPLDDEAGKANCSAVQATGAFLRVTLPGASPQPLDPATMPSNTPRIECPASLSMILEDSRLLAFGRRYRFVECFGGCPNLLVIERN
jgi:hypothetical protein